ncbi:hypothetical protein UlMin_046197 [Ulmus minor]
MLPKSTQVWMDRNGEVVASWSKNNEGEPNKEEDIAMGGSFSFFNSMLEGDWHMGNGLNSPHQDLHGISNHHDMSSPSQPFNLDPSQSQLFSPPQSCFSYVRNVVNGNPFDNGSDLSCARGFLGPFQGNQSSNSPILLGFTGFNSQYQMGSTELNRAKVSRPLEVFPQAGAKPTLFQKRAALRKNSGGAKKLASLEISLPGFDVVLQSFDRKRKKNDEGEIVEPSFEVSGFNYDSGEPDEYSKGEENGKNEGSNSNANSTITRRDQKGKKKKGLPAERRQRKKFNDRSYMLRSVVPKISEDMDFCTSL